MSGGWLTRRIQVKKRKKNMLICLPTADSTYLEVSYIPVRTLCAGGVECRLLLLYHHTRIQNELTGTERDDVERIGRQRVKACQREESRPKSHV